MPIMEGFDQNQKPRQRNIFEVSTKCYPADREPKDLTYPIFIAYVCYGMCIIMRMGLQV